MSEHTAKIFYFDLPSAYLSYVDEYLHDFELAESRLRFLDALIEEWHKRYKRYIFMLRMSVLNSYCEELKPKDFLSIQRGLIARRKML